MTMTMEQQYNSIIGQLKLAMLENDQKKAKTIRKRLEKWQLNYGAYAPITNRNFHKYD